MSNDFKDLFPDDDPLKEGGLLGGKHSSGEPENLGPRALHEKEVRIIGVFEHADPSEGDSRKCFVLLQDNAGRKLPIWIGENEAGAIVMAIQGKQFDRPLTHDLLKIVVDRLGGEVVRIVIDDLWQDVYYAKVTIDQGAESIEIDCRPSDALAIAMRSRAPVYVAEDVLHSMEEA